MVFVYYDDEVIEFWFVLWCECGEGVWVVGEVVLIVVVCDGGVDCCVFCFVDDGVGDCCVVYFEEFVMRCVVGSGCGGGGVVFGYEVILSVDIV